MRFLILFFFILYAAVCHSQVMQPSTKEIIVEKDAAYPGGAKAWKKYLKKNIKINVPIENKAPAGTYVVTVQFVIDKQGMVTNVTASTKHGYGMEDEVIRVIQNSKVWTPAMQLDGTTVKAYNRQTITFFVPKY